MCILSEDLKSFFLTTNGLLIQWSIKFDGNYWQCIFEKIMRVKVNVSWCLHRLQEAGNFGHKEFWVTWLVRLLRIITEHFDGLIRCFISIFSILSGSVLPLGKMELNPVTGQREGERGSILWLKKTNKQTNYFSLCWTLTYISKGMIQAKWIYLLRSNMWSHISRSFLSKICQIWWRGIWTPLILPPRIYHWNRTLNTMILSIIKICPS